MAKAKDDNLGKKLETAVNDMLESVKGDKIDPELKLKVVGMSIKYWAVKNKIGDGSIGSAWYDKPQQEDEE